MNTKELKSFAESEMGEFLGIEKESPIYKGVLKAINVFEKEKLTEDEISTVINYLNILSRGMPLSPLTITNSEWEVIDAPSGKRLYRNIRYNDVFTDEDMNNLHVNSIVYINKKGEVIKKEHKMIDFPYMPTEETILIDDEKGEEI